MRSVICVLATCLFLGTCSPGGRVSGDEGNASQQKIVFFPSGLTVSAEKADTDAKRQRGLMERTDLKEREGMIFYFDRTDRHAFWMFKTLIPLAVVFVNEELVIVDVQYMKPCPSPNSEHCPVYVARRPARMAIEINQGTARRYRIGVGDKIKFEGG